MVSGHYDPPEGYEPEVVNVIDRFVWPGDVAVDAGASVGFFTCLLSERVGDGGQVIAFEPNMESFEHLSRNIRKRDLKNVEAHRIALWEENQPEITLWSVKEIGYTSVCHYYSATGSEVVPAWTLDSFLSSGVRPRFMKVDCEMAELQILRGAERILRGGVDCVITEFNYHLMVQCGVSDHDVRDYMASLGYDMFLISIAEGDGFHPPIRVEPPVEITVEGGLKHINVMFSTMDKVSSAWASN